MYLEIEEPKSYIVQQPSAPVEEPLGITIFKWSIIIVGSVMLGAALFFYTQVSIKRAGWVMWAGKNIFFKIVERAEWKLSKT